MSSIKKLLLNAPSAPVEPVAPVEFYEYYIDNSIRFNDNDAAYLSNTPLIAGNSQVWSFSAWIKRGNITTPNSQAIFSAGDDVDNSTVINLTPTDSIQIIHKDASVTVFDKSSTLVLRDPASWYHIFVAFNSNEASEENIAKIWLNGTRITDFATNTNPTRGFITRMAKANPRALGRNVVDDSRFDGYMTEILFMDGFDLEPTVVGRFKEEIWIPLPYTGSYGTTGFFLNGSTDSTPVSLTDNFDNADGWTINGSHSISGGIAILTNSTTSSMSKPITPGIYTYIEIDFKMVDGGAGDVTSFGLAGLLSLNPHREIAPSKAPQINGVYFPVATLGVWYTVVAQRINSTTVNVKMYNGETLLQDSNTTVNQSIATSISFGGGDPIGYSGYMEAHFDNIYSEGYSPNGSDSSGNDNDFTAVSIDSHDIGYDSPTNNFSVFNNVIGSCYDISSNLTPHHVTYQQGNLYGSGAADTGSAQAMASLSTFGITSGKFYVEITDLTNSRMGISGPLLIEIPQNGIGFDAIVYNSGGTISFGEGATGVVTGTPETFVSTDIIGMTVDRDNSTIEFFKNNVSQCVVSQCNINENEWFIFVTPESSASSYTRAINFGQDSSFGGIKTAQNNTDSNGIGNYYYAPPTGYLALCSKNLADGTLSPSNTVTETEDPITYFLEDSLRFNDDDSAYLSRTQTTTGNTNVFTLSFWVKRADITRDKYIFTTEGSVPGRQSTVQIVANGALRFDIDSNVSGNSLTTGIMTDSSKWYHCVVSYDSSLSVGNRSKCYINGVDETISDTTSGVSYYNISGKTFEIGRNYGGDVQSLIRDFDGYLAETHFIDGQALLPSEFGETKNNTWVPKAYAGTYGTNGFYLKYNDTLLPPPNPSLLTNGTFDTDTSGWSALNGYLLTWDAGEISLNKNSSGSLAGASQPITTEIGTQYTISVDLVSVSGGGEGAVLVGTAAGGSDVTFSFFGTILTTHTFNFTATTTTTYISLGSGGSGTGISNFDNISVVLTSAPPIQISDSSGNANDWTPVNLDDYDQVLDNPSNNFATFDPSTVLASTTLSQGNLLATSNGGTGRSAYSTLSTSIGKWYVEFTGIANSVEIGYLGTPYFRYNSSGDYSNNGTIISGKDSYTSSDIISVAYDATTGFVEFFKNNNSQGTATFTAAIGVDVGFGINGVFAQTDNCYVNFGQDSTFAGTKIGSPGFSDSTGRGEFYYEPPFNYLSLCSLNVSNYTSQYGYPVDTNAPSYIVDNSLRFNDDAGLDRQFSVNGDRTTWTISAWFKPHNTNTSNHLMYSGTTNVSFTQIYINATFGQIVFFERVNLPTSSHDGLITTVNGFTDTSRFYHLTCVWDTTNAIDTDRMRIYVDGERQEVTFLSYPVLNAESRINSTIYGHNIGYSSGGGSFAGAYFGEVNFIDGQALTADDFGQVLNNNWVPKSYTGTYGTNGFYLDFANPAAVGTDASVNTNDWSPVNLATTDQMLDSPTSDYATLNRDGAPVLVNGSTFSEGNLKTTSNAGNFSYTEGYSTLDIPVYGKWYMEVLITIQSGNTTSGLGTTVAPFIYATAEFPVGTIVSVLVDNDAGEIYQYKNNVLFDSFSFTPNILTNHYFRVTPLTGGFGEIREAIANFGQDSSFAGNLTRQGNTDADGIGDFYYAPPSGYKALTRQNVSKETYPTNAGYNPQFIGNSILDNFNTVTYVGSPTNTANTVSQSINGVGFQPDFTWIKSRSSAQSHTLFDNVRGATKWLFSNSAQVELDNSNTQSAFLTDGFETGNSDSTNNNDDLFVAWNWKAGGAPVTNTDGTSTVMLSANQAAGFSIIASTGEGAARTIGHGLSRAPELYIFKPRNTTGGWFVGVDASVNNGSHVFLQLQSTAAATSWGGFFGTSTTLEHNAENGITGITYAFHSVEGYSKIGTYIGNSGAPDGTFVYLGFRPAFVMLKSITSANSWVIYDSTRDTYNTTGYDLYPNLSNAEDTTLDDIDFLSNGFKLKRNSAANTNTVLYIAFAEQPFKYANAR